MGRAAIPTLIRQSPLRQPPIRRSAAESASPSRSLPSASIHIISAAPPRTATSTHSNSRHRVGRGGSKIVQDQRATLHILCFNFFLPCAKTCLFAARARAAATSVAGVRWRRGEYGEAAGAFDIRGAGLPLQLEIGAPSAPLRFGHSDWPSRPRRGGAGRARRPARSRIAMFGANADKSGTGSRSHAVCVCVCVFF